MPRDLFDDGWSEGRAKKKELRPYQADAIYRLKLSLKAKNRRPLLQLPVGAGKTLVAASIISMAREKGSRVAFFVPALSLVDQTVAAFRAEGIDHIGVLQAKHPDEDLTAPVQVATVQTFGSRKVKGGALPPFDFGIWDEAHIRSKALEEAMQADPKKIFVGLSATPWAAGMAHVWDDLVVGTTIGDLIAQGYLSTFRAYASAHPDLSGVKTVAGEYHQGQLGEAMGQSRLVADVVETWLRHGENRPTLCFAVDRAHAAKLQADFQAAGVPAGYVDAFTDSIERDIIRRRFEAGELKVVCNCRTLCLDDQTEILTRQGWRGIDDIQQTDDIAAWSPDGIEFTKPLNIVKRDRQPDEKMVAVTGGTNDVRVTGNHRMVYWAGVNRKKLKVESAESLVGRRLEIPISGIAEPWRFEPTQECCKVMTRRFTSLTYKYRSQGISAQVARDMADEFHARRYGELATKEPSQLSIDECAFIGFWVGDGTRSQGRFALAQSYKYPKIIKWVDDLLARLGLNFTRSEYPPARKGVFASVRWSLSTGRGGRDQAVSGGLSPLMDYLDKSGSDLLWGLNGAQFRAFLHGYWMADGNHGCGEVPSGNGRCLYIADERMVDLIQAIAACRGMGTHKTWHGHIWVVSFRDAERGYYATHRLKLEDTPFVQERVWCVTSTTSFLIVRRNGKVQVIGNTTGVDWPVGCIIDAAPTRSKMLHTQKIGRGLRVNPGIPDLIILDHADNSLRLGLVTDIRQERLSDGTKGEAKAREKADPLPKECGKCGFLKAPKVHECPSCGFAPEKRSAIETEAGELVEITGRKAPETTRADKQRLWSELLAVAQRKGRSRGWCAHALKERAGVWPRGLSDTLAEPSPETLAWVKSKDIRFAKSRGVTA